MLKYLRRCSWSFWIVYHDWKHQIRKEIKEVESENEKSDLSTDQYFGRISLLKNPIDTIEGRLVERILAEKTLYFSFSNSSLNSLLGLGVMFLLYGMNIQYDSF